MKPQRRREGEIRRRGRIKNLGDAEVRRRASAESLDRHRFAGDFALDMTQVSLASAGRGADPLP